ncbi:MAG: hypothetical protein OXG15_01295 [Gammaproteobacteria bacterium]|nr:hypothetical protein [Gammaproteobacteria bacterium]
MRLQINNKLPLTMQMEFGFSTGEVQYKTTWGSGQKHGFEPPRELHGLMDRNFVNFYIFDGELADDLLNPEKTDALTAVESLFQIQLLSEMATKIKDHWDAITQGRTSKGQRGLSRSQNKLKQWRIHLKSLKERAERLENDIRKVNSQIQRKEELYRDHIAIEGDLSDKMKEAQTHSQTSEEFFKKKTQFVLDEMRSPQALSPAFANCMLEFRSQLDRVKLPETAAREWFAELLEEAKCVCGRPMDQAARSVIRERSAEYLGSDDINVLNRIKSDISRAVGGRPSQAAMDLVRSMEELADLSNQKKRADNQLFLLRHQAEQANPVAARAGKEINELKERAKELERELAPIQDESQNLPTDKLKQLKPELVVSIPTANKCVELYETEAAERADTVKQRLKRDVLVRIVEQAHEQAKRKIADEIRRETNGRIAELMPDNAVRVDRIEGALILRGQTGGSAGENLSVGYAFLATLFNRSNRHELPFVLDSPVAPIDGAIRPTIGKLLPRLTGQIIAFTISTEREGFLRPLEREMRGGQVKYLTLFRRGITHLEERVSQMPEVTTATQDGFLVSGREFFNDFQVESDEPE